MRSLGTIARALIASLAAGVTLSAIAVEHSVPFFPSASDDLRQGFVRIVNHSLKSGEISVFAVDDQGHRFGPLSLTLDADEVFHFNSDDLERGNPIKGLSGQTGPGAGDWRLQIQADVDIEVLSYVRTSDGFLTAMHDVATMRDDRYRVPTFNPGSNIDQVSLLRLANPGDESVQVSIHGTDDSGDSTERTVRVSIDPRASRMFTAAELETGGTGMQGRLGDGTGKWRLAIEATRPIIVMSLLSSPTGHLTTLPTDPSPLGLAGEHLVPLFPSASDEVRQGFVRVINRSDEAGEVRIWARDRDAAFHGTLTLAVGARQAAHFNSDDLELGNADKGLTGSTGAGNGDWRLGLSSDLDIDVLAYIRTRDGFLTAIGDLVPSVGRRHRVAIFNPARNTGQASLLRLINLGGREAHVMIEGVDDRGTPSATVFETPIAPRAVRTVTARELEAGLGIHPLESGFGKWRLTVLSVSTPGIEVGLFSNLRQPIAAMSLLANPSGHLTNLSTASRCAHTERFRDVLADGDDGPEMVVIPAGRYDMGCTTVDCEEGAKPVHEVNINEPFALSRTEVTFAQWDACVAAGGCNGYSPRDRYWGRRDRPVIYVGREDAVAYASWLSAQTGARYRLPSEAEWEYAARAESPATFTWGDAVGDGRANCAGCGGRWDALVFLPLSLILGGTAPVGTFAGNAFCLHDMHGNVGEWVADYWNETYDGAPTDGSPWLTGDASWFVFRGGSWAAPGSVMGSSVRTATTRTRSAYIGFRIARSLQDAP